MKSSNSMSKEINEKRNIYFKYINENKKKIEEKEKNLKLMITSNGINITRNGLTIEKIKEIEKLIDEIKNLKEKNKELEEKINDIEIRQKKGINIIEKNDYIFKNEYKNRINRNNEVEKNNNNINKLNNFYLKFIDSINPHDDIINLITYFPSGNIISISSDKSIKIYNNNFNIIQNILNPRDSNIIYLSIKDENNFATCSLNNKIKTWKKNTNEYLFTLNKTINKAHDYLINQIKYCLNGNIISCSEDQTIKIWEENNYNEYQCITILMNNISILSILLLEDKNILISSGDNGTKFWNLNNYEFIIYIKDAICKLNKALKRIDKYRIIVGGNDDGIIKIISINERKIIKEIKNGFLCLTICVLENKQLFLTGGFSREIKIYKTNNYECIQIINEAHNDEIYGINKLKNHFIVSYGEDIKIKIWSF